jgi:hypothetical protein
MSHARPRQLLLLLVIAGCSGAAVSPPRKHGPEVVDAAPPQVHAQPDAAPADDRAPAPDSSVAADTKAATPDAGTPDLGPLQPTPVLAECPEASPQRLAGTVEVPLAVQILAAGQPARAGQEVLRADGVTVKLSLFHAFLADPWLLDASGRWVKAQLTDGHGTPLPYGLALIDLEKPASLGVAGPPGNYAGLQLGVGVPAACNHGDSTRRAPPLDADSDMYWSWGSQYLFIRLEGTTHTVMTPAPRLLELHMGLDPFYRNALVAGSLDLGRDASPRTLVFDLDGLLRPDDAKAAPINAFNVPEWVPEHIARGAVLRWKP